MSLKMKEEPLTLSDSTVLTNDLHFNIKKEPFDPECYFVAHSTPLNIKEELLEQSRNYFFNNNIPLCIKEESLEHCQSFTLSDNQPLYIQIDNLKETQNCSSTNILPNIKEEPLELLDDSSNESVHINSEDKPIQPFNNSIVINKTSIKEEHEINKTSIKEEPEVLLHAFSMQNNMPSNVKKKVMSLPNTSTDTTEIANYVPLKKEIEENSESCNSSFFSVAVSENNKNCPKVKNNIICEKTSKKEYYMTEKNILNSRNTSTSHSLSSLINVNYNEPVLANNSDYLSDLDSKNSFRELITHKNITKSNVSAVPSSYVSLPLLTPLHDDTLRNVQDPNIKNNAINFLLINNLCNSQNSPNSSIFVQTSNHKKHISNMTEKPKVIKHNGVSEITPEDTVLRGIESESLKLDLLKSSGKSSRIKKTGLNIPSIINKVPSENQRKIIQKEPIIHNKSIINPSISYCLKNPEENKAKRIKQLSGTSHNGVFLVENTENSGNETFSNNKLNNKINVESAEKSCMQNTSQIQNKQIKNICNVKSLLQSSQSTCYSKVPIENTRKSMNMRISGKYSDSINVQNLKKKEKYIAKNSILSLDNIHHDLVHVTEKTVNKKISNALSNSVAVGSKKVRIRNSSHIQNQTNKKKSNLGNFIQTSGATENRAFLADNVTNSVSKRISKNASKTSNTKNFKISRKKNASEFQNEQVQKMFNNESSLQPSLSAQNFTFLVKNTGNTINVWISDKANNLIATHDVQARIKNNKELQNKWEGEKCNARSLLKSSKLNDVCDSVHLIKETIKVVDQGILNADRESVKYENLNEARKENASQFQSESNIGKPHPRSILRASYETQKSTVFAKNVGKSIDVQNSCETLVNISNEFQNKQHKENCLSHAVNNLTSISENTEKPMMKNIDAEVSKNKAETEKNALVYDGVNTSPQETALKNILKPLYKYWKNNKCLLCGFESKRADIYTIRRHLMCHLPKNFKCDACGKLFSSPESLSVHKTNVHIKIEVSCEECNQNFSSPTALNFHRRKHHNPAQTFVCLICNCKYTKFFRLTEHYRTHTSQKTYTCVVCNEIFRTRHSLNVHSLKHRNREIYSCPKCDKSYKSKALLNRHRNSHTNLSEVKCHICNKSFICKSSLYQHRLSHFNLHRHECKTCGLKFKLSHHLKNHISSCH